MNQWEIEDLVNRVLSRNDANAKYARYLRDWVRIVNSNSDGWAYWVAGRKAGEKLADLLKITLDNKPVSTGDWNRAIGGIKRVATAQLKHHNNIPVPELGSLL